ncbi:MAG TPA: hypothetical protein DF699_01390, partial [Phycisphaerales bacterium]|nr:hypothetical protein [Phycisphaerales bacterium]
MKSGKTLTWLIIALLAALALPNVISLLRGPAPTPDVFAAGYTLTEAIEMSAQNDKPVLVLATADWCAPCQALKRGALTDPQVAELIRENTIPVYLEDGDNSAEIGELGVPAFPTTMILERGQVTAMLEGGA